MRPGCALVRIRLVTALRVRHVRRGGVRRGQLVRVTEGPVTEQQRHDDHDNVEPARPRRRGAARLQGPHPPPNTHETPSSRPSHRTTPTPKLPTSTPF